MRKAATWLTALCGSVLLAVGVLAAPPQPATDPAPTTSTDPDLQRYLDRLSQLSEYIGKNSEQAQIWRYQLAQGEVLLHLAARSTGKERDNWLRMAVDSYYSAAMQTADNDSTAPQWLAALVAQLAREVPGNPVVGYAARQEVQADYTRMLVKSDDSAKVQVYLCERLMRFAHEYPATAEAPKAAQEAAQLYEEMHKLDDARRCYRYLAERYPNESMGRKAGGSLWRLGLGGEAVHLRLPLLFPSGPTEQTFDLSEMHGNLVVVYFWSSKDAQTADDFASLEQLTDHYQYHGLSVVYVNLDNDPAAARAFLAGRLTSGVHVHQGGGLDSPVAERYGLQSLPQLFLVARSGTLIQHSRKVEEIEPAVSGQLGGHGR